MSSAEITGDTHLTQGEHIRYLARRAMPGPLELVEATPTERAAIAQTILVHDWIAELWDDALENYRGGTDEKTDVPLPTMPEGPLVPYILAAYGIVGAGSPGNARPD